MIPRLAAHEWLILANGEVRYTLNTSRSRTANFVVGLALPLRFEYTFTNDVRTLTNLNR